VSGQLHTSAALPPGKEAPRTHWIGGLVHPRVGLDYMEKIKLLLLLGSDPSVVQAVASRYTDYATAANIYLSYF
jgi:hypothetical protein